MASKEDTRSVPSSRNSPDTTQLRNSQCHPHTSWVASIRLLVSAKVTKQVLLCHTSASETQFPGILVAIPLEYFLCLPFLLLLDVPCLTHTYMVVLNPIANPRSRIGLQHLKFVMPLTIIIQTDSCISAPHPKICTIWARTTPYCYNINAEEVSKTLTCVLWFHVWTDIIFPWKWFVNPLSPYFPECPCLKIMWSWELLVTSSIHLPNHMKLP